MDLHELIQNKVAHVGLMSQSGMPPGSRQYEQLVADGASGCIQVARRSRTISTDVAVRIQATISELFTADQVNTIMGVVNSKVNLSVAATASADK